MKTDKLKELLNMFELKGYYDLLMQEKIHSKYWIINLT